MAGFRIAERSEARSNIAGEITRDEQHERVSATTPTRVVRRAMETWGLSSIPRSSGAGYWLVLAAGGDDRLRELERPQTICA
jgi:hypothetical protein